MTFFIKQVPAINLGVRPCCIKNKEHKGVLYLPPSEHHYSEAVGSQCVICNNILWITGRWNPILNKKFIDLEGRRAYSEFYQDKIHKFLISLPPCPECNHKKYDLFLDNITIPRFKDGSSFCSGDIENDLLTEKLSNSLVWWYGNEEELCRILG